MLPGETADPYRVWLSEIMLQQTTVAAVGPYYARFLAAFPTIAALARADEAEVFAVWAGLGYYSRARNLHACAKLVAEAGGFPDTVAGLEALPGIGPYTARAVAAIAFGVPVVPVDGNVERVTARLFAVRTPMPAAKASLAALAQTLNAGEAARARASDFAQALFDLGATICTPRSPACVLCPWRDPCAAQAQGIAAELPVRATKVVRPQRYGIAWRLRDASGLLLLERRPPRGLLGGMLGLPGPVWSGEPACTTPPAGVSLWREVGTVRHVFTHFALDLRVFDGRIDPGSAARLVASPLWSAEAVPAGLPGLFAKAMSLPG